MWVFKQLDLETVVKSAEPKRPIKKVIIHHTGFEAPYKGLSSWEAIHKAHKAKGWSGIGYHYGVSPEGNLWVLRPVHLVGAHCVGHNSDSVGIVLWGKGEKPLAQLISAVRLAKRLAERFNAEVYFHNELGKTVCPEIKRSVWNRLWEVIK